MEDIAVKNRVLKATECEKNVFFAILDDFDPQGITFSSFVFYVANLRHVQNTTPFSDKLYLLRFGRSSTANVGPIKREKKKEKKIFISRLYKSLPRDLIEHTQVLL